MSQIKLLKNMYSNYYSLINSVRNDKVRFSQIFLFD